jgi:hypothetical protein
MYMPLSLIVSRIRAAAADAEMRETGAKIKQFYPQSEQFMRQTDGWLYLMVLIRKKVELSTWW